MTLLFSASYLKSARAFSLPRRSIFDIAHTPFFADFRLHMAFLGRPPSISPAFTRHHDSFSPGFRLYFFMLHYAVFVTTFILFDAAAADLFALFRSACPFFCPDASDAIAFIPRDASARRQFILSFRGSAFVCRPR